jgi:GNAT superfamily N-acetyltransferase
MIRPATVHDTDRIVEMCERFYHITKYIKFAPYDEPTIRELTELLIATGVVLVADLKGELVGLLGMFIGPYLFNRNKIVAHEVVFWVEPEGQGLGVGRELNSAATIVCQERGAVAAQMVKLDTSPPLVSALYESLGYYHSECSYTKVL